MKKTEKAKLNQHSVEELQAQIVQLEQELVRKQAEHKLGKLKNTKTTYKIRKTIAVAKTLITVKQLQTPVKETQ